MNNERRDKFRGKCHCGNSTYEAESEKKFEFLCHCTDCRVLNGGGHLSGLMSYKKDFKPFGEIQKYSYKGGSGNEIDLHFCSICGTHLYAFPRAQEDYVVIMANTLDDSNIYAPKKSIFIESAYSWDNCILKSENEA